MTDAAAPPIGPTPKSLCLRQIPEVVYPRPPGTHVATLWITFVPPTLEKLKEWSCRAWAPLDESLTMSGSGRRKADRAPGFTMTELMMAIALMGIIVTIGAQRVDVAVWRLDTSAQEVMQRLRAGRALAILRQHDVIVRFDTGGGVVIVHEDANNDGEINTGERVRRYVLEGGMELTRGSAPAYAGFTGGAVTFDNQVVTFYRNGSASQEGAVYVGGAGVASARVVVISRATGYAQIHRYDGSRWLSD